MFSKAKIAQLKTKFSSIDTNDINDSSLRAKAAKLKAKQGGFTLLELLVVVAILAAIAGTASIALQDTDARASAAAHVTMMDELNKGIRTYRVLNKNTYPNRFDSLLGSTGLASAATFPSNGLVAIDDIGKLALTESAIDKLKDLGITELQYLDFDNVADFDEDGTATDCADANITTTIASRSNHVVSNNIFLTPKANGCGETVALATGHLVSIWTGGYERIYGGDGAAYDVAGSATDGTDVATKGATITTGFSTAPVVMAVGLGPSSNLFNANELGGMTTVPSYRHVSEQQYGRFIALFEIGTFTGTDAAYTVADQVNLVAIVDGAGDTKEEELGEWDGTRNTI
jgi:prepilin-type N-terminal cleavage/methylation domain-containing protein